MTTTAARLARPACLCVFAFAFGCASGPLDASGDDAAAHDHSAHDGELGTSSEALSSISCSERSDTGYVRGSSFAISVVTVDGKPVERDTANAYYVMAQAASRAGVEIRIVSGFRTMAQQQYLYNCYTSCSCNSCNLAARPGYSNHQSGHALDLNTSASGVLSWLNANASRYGFARTVSSEPWHWEWWGGGPGGGPCGARCTPHCEGSRIVSASCGVGDCGVYGATCVDDSAGVRCASVFCPARGTATVCLDDRTIGNCDDGAISTGDCGAYGAYCSSAGASAARCVSVFCVAGPDEVPTAHDVCLPNGELGHCNRAGAVSSTEACGAGTSCQADASGRFACLAGGASPVGALALASCDAVSGWTSDPDEPEATNRAHVYFDGRPGADGAVGVSLAADDAGGADCEGPACGHGFSMLAPLSLFDEEPHEVRAYGINLLAGSNAQLDDSPQTIRCAPPTLEGSRRPLLDPTVLASWRFDRFQDLAPTGDAAIERLSVGANVPALPRLVSAGDGDLWLLDGAVRRFVDEPARRAWRFAQGDVESISAAALADVPEGPALRARPLLVEHSDGTLSLVDDVPVPAERGEDPTDSGPRDADSGEPGLGEPRPGEPRPREPGASLSGGCVAAPGPSAPSAGWLLLLAGLLISRRRRSS